MWVTILDSKDMGELLSLISFGTGFQVCVVCAPSNKKFFSCYCILVKPVFHLAFFPREQAKSECDWVVMSPVFVASQSSWREQISSVFAPSGKQAIRGCGSKRN